MTNNDKFSQEMEDRFRRMQEEMDSDFFNEATEPLEQFRPLIKEAKRSVLKAAIIGAVGTVLTITLVLGAATLAIGGALKLLGAF